MSSDFDFDSIPDNEGTAFGAGYSLADMAKEVEFETDEESFVPDAQDSHPAESPLPPRPNVEKKPMEKEVDIPEQEVVEEEPVETVDEMVTTQEPAQPVSNDKELIVRIAKIIDVYRSLQHSERVEVSKVISGGKFIDNEPDFVMSVMNVNPMLKESMLVLVETKEMDQIDRAFRMMELDEKSCKNLAKIVSAFVSDADFSNVTSKSELAKALVKNVDKIDSSVMNNVKTIGKLLSI